VNAVMDDGILVALDGKTGKEHYRERLMSETLAVSVELGELRIERA